MSIRAASRRLCLGLGLVAVSFCSLLAPQLSLAQDTTLYISIRDTFAYPGQEVHLPVVVTTLRDTIDAYQIQYVADRPNMILFRDTMVVETLIVCANPPACTAMDTTIDTVPRTPIDTRATLTTGWELVSATNMGLPTVVRVSAISDLTGDNMPRGIPPGTQGATLIRLVVLVDCPPDQFGGGMVQLFPSPLSFNFSDPLGQLIEPVSAGKVVIRILDPVTGDLDYSGAADVLDVLKMIQCVFMNGCPTCASLPTDFNCDHQVNVLDVLRLIGYVFQGAPLPGC